MQLRLVGIVVRPDSPEAVRCACELVDWLKGRGIAAADLNEVEAGMDLLVVLGGDGTLLHAAEAAGRLGLPVLGVNLGNLGFLTEVTQDELYKTLAMLLAGECRIEERVMLSASVLDGADGTVSGPFLALNEVVIVKTSTAAMIRLHCWADEEYVTTYAADGLIIATPTGSTAYNLSAGGPLVHAEQHCLILTPICPFMLDSRPVLLSSDSRVTACLQGPARPVNVVVDGERRRRLGPGDLLLVRKAEHPLLVISSPWKSYFRILRAKLHWGGDPVDLPLPGAARRLG